MTLTRTNRAMNDRMRSVATELGVAKRGQAKTRIIPQAQAVAVAEARLAVAYAAREMADGETMLFRKGAMHVKMPKEAFYDCYERVEERGERGENDGDEAEKRRGGVASREDFGA